jgi:hypothetical protein
MVERMKKQSQFVSYCVPRDAYCVKKSRMLEKIHIISEICGLKKQSQFSNGVHEI